jgi:dUTP pyrophosphatase
MKIKIKRFDKNLPLPEYKTAGAAGFDLAARETMTIAPHAVAYVPLNVAVETPPDHFLLIATRGSTHKRGLMLANSVGIGDSDFCGDEDQYMAALLNFTDKPVVVERGDRIAQGIFIKFTRGEWEEVDKMENKTRGGFGSTGTK